LALLRTVLADANYTESGVAAALGLPTGSLGFQSAEVPLLQRRLDACDSVTLRRLIELFLLGCPVAPDDAAAALRPLQLADLSGLLAIDRDGKIGAHLRLSPYAGFVFAHDANGPLAPAPDYVMGIGNASRTLAGLTVRKPVESALDVGAGCGVQAVLAAQHARHVSAVELNPRAVHLGLLNARLNGVHNIESLEGSLFEPVAGKQFDLVVSNPPYVISPDSTYVFRDSGRPGDTMSRIVVAQAARVLREGGFAHVLCNWGHRVSQSWWEPLVEWVDGCGCDAWLLHYHSQDPLTYAAQWHAELQSTDPDAYMRTLDRWLAHYRATGTEVIASGAVVLRRRTTGNRSWIRWDEMPRAPTGSGSDHVERIFAAYDALEDLSDDAAFVGETFELVNGHQLAQRLVYRDGSYAIADASMVLDAGVGLEAGVPAACLPILLRVDGERPLAALIDEVAAETGMAPDVLRAVAVRTARELFSRGMLTRVAR
jgi:methylase of polypeptide subunit release factors